jgi:hypothetical protein
LIRNLFPASEKTKIIQQLRTLFFLIPLLVSFLIHEKAPIFNVFFLNKIVGKTPVVKHVHKSKFDLLLTIFLIADAVFFTSLPIEVDLGISTV